MTSEYYKNHDIRQRMVHFLGGSSLDDATAAYLTASGPGQAESTPRPVCELDRYLADGLDIGRSLWDREHLVVHLDIDYANFTFPGEPYVDPSRTFTVLGPVVEAVRHRLESWGITPLELLSGRGHHLVWSIRQGSESFRRLVDVGRLSPSLQGTYRQRYGPPGWCVGLELGRAHAGLGMVLEDLCHRIIDSVAWRSEAPVAITAVEVDDQGNKGAEVVSLDISEYADPLHLRTTRVAFSVYLKPQQREHVLGAHVVEPLPPLFLIPLAGLSVNEALDIRTDPARVAELARDVDAWIPELSEASMGMIEAYERSSLAKYHNWFYSAEPEPTERWPVTYDLARFDHLPPSGREPLEQPRDLLMQPGRIREVVRLLLGEGWHPRHIAGLIQSKYERDHGWGDYWFRYDATSRAEFYTRVFAGMFQVSGADASGDPSP
jgi:hypothetical protein